MTISSCTRGRVAGSSLAVKGISLSRASGLNPEVDPTSPHKTRVRDLFGFNKSKTHRLTGLEMKDEMESGI